MLHERDRHMRVTVDVNGIRVRPSETLVSEVEKICGTGSVSRRDDPAAQDPRDLLCQCLPDTLEFEEPIAVLLKEIEALSMLPQTPQRQVGSTACNRRIESIRADIYPR